MLNIKDLFGISGIAAAITGCVIGATLIIKTEMECRKERKEMKAIMDDIENKSKQVDEFLERHNINLK